VLNEGHFVNFAKKLVAIATSLEESEQEGLAVASIAQDDPSTLPDDDSRQLNYK